MVQHHNTGFCGRGRVLPVNTGSGSRVYSCDHPPRRPIGSLCGRSRWPAAGRGRTSADGAPVSCGSSCTASRTHTGRALANWNQNNIITHIVHLKEYTHGFDLLLFGCGTQILQIQFQEYFNSLIPERFGYDYKNVIFSLALQTGIFRSYDNVIRWMPQDLPDDVNIGSGNGLVPSGNKPLPVRANVDPDLCCHMASLGHNELVY